MVLFSLIKTLTLESIWDKKVIKKLNLEGKH